MKKIILALGSNIGDRKKNLKKALNILEKNISICKISRIYVSKAVGYTNQPDFYNMVISGNTKLDPFELLNFVKNVEKQVGRVYRFHWGPREIDIDIIFYEDEIIKTENLIVPHPLMHKRDFVLKPLMEIEPHIKHPVLNKNVKELYFSLDEFSIVDEIEF